MDAGSNRDPEQWAAQLPMAVAEFGDGLLLTGYLVPTEADEIRIVVGGVCLSFSSGDVLDLAPVGAAEQVGMSPSAGTARIAIRRGAPLLDARLGMLIHESSRRPFALSTRPLSLMLDLAPRFRELERRFLLSHSLTSA